MTSRQRIGRVVNFVLRRAGLRLLSTAPPRVPAGAAVGSAPLPEGAAEILRPDNPRLRELERRYAAMPVEVTTPDLWKPGHVNPYEMRYFRGDNAYVWQLRGGEAEANYALTAYYLQSIDRLGLLD